MWLTLITTIFKGVLQALGMAHDKELRNEGAKAEALDQAQGEQKALVDDRIRDAGPGFAGRVRDDHGIGGGP